MFVKSDATNHMPDPKKDRSLTEMSVQIKEVMIYSTVIRTL